MPPFLTTMTPREQLLKKLADKSAVIGIYGLGYVGLPLALRFTEVGYPVLGFDIDKSKVDALMQGRSYIEHIRLQKPLTATTDFSRTPECDALIVCVPTPLNKFREPDLSFVMNTVDSLAPYLRPGQILSLESTTYPGTTEEELRPRVEARKLKIGDEVFLCFSPEREDPGNPEFVTRTIPKVVGGSTPARLIVDTRGVYLDPAANVVKA